MGLSITAYRKIMLLKELDPEDPYTNLTYAEQDGLDHDLEIFREGDFEGRMAPHPPAGLYRVEGPMEGRRACGNYGEFRQWLCRMVNGGIEPLDVWNDKEPEKYRLWRWIDFSDGGGLALGPEACRFIADELDEIGPHVRALRPREKPLTIHTGFVDHFEKFERWWELFKHARDGGAVQFD